MIAKDSNDDFLNKTGDTVFYLQRKSIGDLKAPAGITVNKQAIRQVMIRTFNDNQETSK